MSFTHFAQFSALFRLVKELIIIIIIISSSIFTLYGIYINNISVCRMGEDQRGHCATSRKVVGSIPDGVIGIFHWHNPSCRNTALGSTQSLTEMSTRIISWEPKAAGAWSWQLYHLHVTIFLKTGSLKLLEHQGLSSQSQWPRVLMSGSAAARLLGLRGSNSFGGMDVFLFWVLYVVQVDVSASGWSLAQRSTIDCGASLCVT